MHHHIFKPIHAHVDNYTMYVFGINIYICEMVISFLFELKIEWSCEILEVRKENGTQFGTNFIIFWEINHKPPCNMMLYPFIKKT